MKDYLIEILYID